MTWTVRYGWCRENSREFTHAEDAAAFYLSPLAQAESYGPSMFAPDADEAMSEDEIEGKEYVSTDNGD